MDGKHLDTICKMIQSTDDHDYALGCRILIDQDCAATARA